MWRGNSKVRNGFCFALLGGIVATSACGGDDPATISDRGKGGSSGSSGASGSGAGVAGSSGSSGSGGSITGGTAGSGGSAGTTAGSAGTAGSGGSGNEGGEGGDGAGGEGGEAGTMMGGMGGMGGAGTGGMAGTGGAGMGGNAGKAGGGAGGAGTGGGGGKAGNAGGGGKAGTAGGGGKAGGAGAGGAGAGGGGTGGSGGTAMGPNLFFSEYVEGANVADAFEIYNASGAPVNLAGCEIRVHYAAAVGSTAVTLSGTLDAGDVFVVCLANISFACNAVTMALPDLSGDDAVELACTVGASSVTLDVIGQYGMGLDPGVEWGSGMTGTQNQTLRRQCSVTTGDRNPTNAFNPATEWTGRAADNINGLGGRLCPCTTANQNICP